MGNAMNVLLQLVIGLAVLLPAAWFAEHHVRRLLAFLAGRRLQRLVVAQCADVIENRRNTDHQRLVAGHLAIAILSPPTIEMMTKPSVIAALNRSKSEDGQMDPKDRQVLDGALRCASLASMLYAREHQKFVLWLLSRPGFDPCQDAKPQVMGPSCEEDLPKEIRDEAQRRQNVIERELVLAAA